MKLSTNWLKEYINMNISLETLAEGLTMAGLEVEEMKSFSKQDFTNAGGGGDQEDLVFDVKITPNRGDWLSVLGVAREAAHLVGSKAQLKTPEFKSAAPSSKDMIKISITAPEFCRRYVGIVIRNVEIKESPGWMKDRIIAAGMRPINNIVDITNYVMLEFGQPLHAFDCDLIGGKEIIVRRANDNEKMKTLDDVERTLDSEMLVIADANNPRAIAGIMGGAESEIGPDTKNILIESANFDSVCVRRTSKRLGLVTESSYRFERGVDPSVTPLAALRAAELISELAGGEVAEGMVDICPSPIEPLVIEIRPERVNTMLGTSISPEDMAKFLGELEIDATVVSDKLICKVPTFRSDITTEIDLVEEVGRVYGYDNLPTTLPKKSMQGKDSPVGIFRNKLRRILMSAGAQEVLTHSLVEAKLADLCGFSENRLNLRNPLSEELNSMRIMLTPNILQVIARNQTRDIADISIFEIGNVYSMDKAGKTHEKTAIAGAMVGNLWDSGWSLPVQSLEADFFACKGLVESLLKALHIENSKYVKINHKLLHPTRAAAIYVNDIEIGILGEVLPEACDILNLRGKPCVFEIDLNNLIEVTPEIVTFKDLPKFPASYRHLTAIVPDGTDYACLVESMKDAGGSLLESIQLLDVYRSEQIGEDLSSMTFSIVIRSKEKTLTDEESNACLSNIKEVLVKNHKVTYRQ